MGAPKEQTVTQKSEPWAGAQKMFLDTLYPAAQQAFNATNKQQYSGDLWQNPTALQERANAQMGTNQWQQGAGGVRAQADATLAGNYMPSTDYMYADKNPYLKGAVDTALGDVTRRYTREVLPQIGDAAIKAGAYGGDRQALAQGTAAGEYSREANAAATNIYAQNYASERNLYAQQTEAERGRQQQAGQLYNQANTLEQQHIQGLAGAGQQQQQWGQGQLGEDYQRWQMAQAAPWAGIPELLSVLTGGNFQSTATTGPNPNYTNPMQMISGLGSLVTGLGSMFGSGTGFPPAPLTGNLS